MVNHSMGHEAFDANVTAIFIRDENGVGYVNVLTHEPRKALGVQLGLLNRAGNDVSATLNHAHYRGFGSATAPLVRPCALAGLASDIAFIHFHDASEQITLVKHRIANPHPHVPAGILVDL